MDRVHAASVEGPGCRIDVAPMGSDSEIHPTGRRLVPGPLYYTLTDQERNLAPPSAKDVGLSLDQTEQRHAKVVDHAHENAKPGDSPCILDRPVISRQRNERARAVQRNPQQHVNRSQRVQIVSARNRRCRWLDRFVARGYRMHR